MLEVVEGAIVEDSLDIGGVLSIALVIKEAINEVVEGVEEMLAVAEEEGLS